jgi:site-specific DNA-methyltransferase (adenine-specific)
MQSAQSFINRVFHGDCIDVLRKIPSNSFDLVVADPPYIVNYRPKSGGRNHYPNDDNHAWLKPAFAEVFRTLKNDRLCVCFYGWPRAENFLHAWKDAGFRPVSHLVWQKNYASKTRFTRACHESAYLLAKGRPPFPVDPRSDVFQSGFVGARLHPAQKPVDLMAQLIEAFSRPGDLILDPFTGSGTTAVAARETGRNFVAIEKLWRNYAIACERLKCDPAFVHEQTP